MIIPHNGTDHDQRRGPTYERARARISYDCSTRYSLHRLFKVKGHRLFYLIHRSPVTRKEYILNRQCKVNLRKRNAGMHGSRTLVGNLGRWFVSRFFESSTPYVARDRPDAAKCVKRAYTPAVVGARLVLLHGFFFHGRIVRNRTARVSCCVPG